jgi:4'-phosphopantetheinyl transferase EntD
MGAQCVCQALLAQCNGSPRACSQGHSPTAGWPGAVVGIFATCNSMQLATCMDGRSFA